MIECWINLQAQISKPERIQNEATKAVLRFTRDTPIIAMCYLVHMPSMKVKHKYAQVKMYFRVASTANHPLLHILNSEKGKHIKQERYGWWMQKRHC